MLALAAAGAGEGWWLRAERQTAGRGRQGRVWVSEPGNLHASTLVRLRPTDPPAPTLALVAGVALWDAVALLGCRDNMDQGGALRLKWPNDLLLGGAKLAGVLLERAGDAVVIGAGINVGHHPDLPDRRTTSLASQNMPIDAATLADALAEVFARWLARWRGEGLLAIRAAWLDRAHPVGAALAARLPHGETVDGLFDGLDPTGALLLRLASGERRVIHAADLFLL